MILKQTILNLLAKTNIGGWISGLINGATGTGGSAGGDAGMAAAGATLTTAA